MSNRSDRRNDQSEWEHRMSWFGLFVLFCALFVILGLVGYAVSGGFSTSPPPTAKSVTAYEQIVKYCTGLVGVTNASSNTAWSSIAACVHQGVYVYLHAGYVPKVVH